MSESPIPEARIADTRASARFRRALHRSVARPLKAIWRFTRGALPGIGVIGVCVLLIGLTYRHCEAESREKEQKCLSQAGALKNVERVVRDTEGLLVYVGDPSTPVLKEYRFGIHAFSTVDFVTSVSSGDRMQIVWVSRMNSSEQCVTHTAVHIRSARDIE